VTKYEPDAENADGAARLPYDLSKYDIEGADRNKELVTYLLDKDVMVTEKLEGSNVSVAIGLDGNVHVNTRRRSVLEDSSDGKMYWEGAKSSGMFAFAKYLFSRLLGRQLVVVYGELLGPKVQGNIYGMGSFTTRIFDVKIGDAWLPPQSLLEEIGDYTVLPISSVPVLYIGKFSDWLEGRTVKDASNGWSVLNEGRRREGIVIRPLVEEEIPRFGRLILKQRSPEYLLHSKV
jgi:RNA ligase (TIGR02306 family)